MNRRAKGIFLAVVGLILFVAAILILVYVVSLYLVALLLLFSSVVLVGVGAALVKGNDGSLEAKTDECYYCRGTGMIEGVVGKETCPRCGGTGLGRPDD